MKSNKNFLNLFCIALVLWVTVFPSTVHATKIEISGNGSGSTNTIDIEREITTETDQSNESEVENEVEVEQNSGGNSIDDNTGGDSEISTGDNTASAEVENSVGENNLDYDPVNISDLQIEIIGNGSDSENAVNITSTITHEVTLENHTSIKNNLLLDSNTGRNDITDNTGGNSLIKTGDIYNEDAIVNNSNLNFAKLSTLSTTEISALIQGNGAGSVNIINFIDTAEEFINMINILDVDNNIENYLNTGENSIDGNTGGTAKIITGNIRSITSIENVGGVNCLNVPFKDCPSPFDPDDEDDDDDTEIDPGCLTNCGGGGNNNGGGRGGNGDDDDDDDSSHISYSDSEEVLPRTGVDWLMIALMGNTLMLLLGWYLRLRSGRAS